MTTKNWDQLSSYLKMTICRWIDNITFCWKSSSFFRSRCWGLERFRSQVRFNAMIDPVGLGLHRNHKGGKSLWGGFGTPEVGSCDLGHWICCFGDFCCFLPLVNHNEITIWENGFYVSRSILSKSKSMSDIGQLVIGSLWTRCSLWWAGYLYVLLVFVKMLFENPFKKTKVGLWCCK